MFVALFFIMNKRGVWIFVILLIGLFVVSACENYVGRRISRANDNLIIDNI